MQALGSDAVAIKADMSKPEDVERLFKETAAAFSDPVSILVSLSASQATSHWCGRRGAVGGVLMVD